MKKMGVRFSLVVLVACACLLAGCAGGRGQEGSSKDDYVGSWNLNSIEAESSDASQDADAVAELSNLGLTISLLVEESGSAEFDLFGDKIPGTWAVGDTGAILNLNDTEYTMVLDEGLLQVEMDSQTYVFSRED
ncbi:MAG: hypothetical protein IJ131_11310 [Eggerthellaceae bacterium]|nr:hypothetical protein [Eggerthellaceae bacterium]